MRRKRAAPTESVDDAMLMVDQLIEENLAVMAQSRAVLDRLQHELDLRARAIRDGLTEDNKDGNDAGTG